MLDAGHASKVLAAWRERVVEDWTNRYDDRDRGHDTPLTILGFETYIVEKDHSDGKRRVGACYRFDGWTNVGRTSTGKLLYCRKNERGRELYEGTECLI